MALTKDKAQPNKGAAQAGGTLQTEATPPKANKATASVRRFRAIHDYPVCDHVLGITFRRTEWTSVPVKDVSRWIEVQIQAGVLAEEV